MPKLIDLSGKTFGYLSVIQRTENRTSQSGSSSAMWICRCECGKLTTVSGAALRKGQTVSCGCKRGALISSKKLVDLSGLRFGRLLVIERSYARHDNVHRRVYYKCKCDCGMDVIVCSDSLRNGDTQSCGCLHIERAKLSSTTHGLSSTRIYGIYHKMIERCYSKASPAYDYYGGRGISVCDEWLDSFTAFYDWATSHGYDDTLSIDRIDVNGNYEPQNCRWSDFTEQANNRRSNIIVEYDSRKQTVAQWSRELGIDYNHLLNAIKNGVSISEFLSY